MTTKFDVIEWFAEKAGKTCYRDNVIALRAKIADADDPALIVKYEEEIEREYREAQDRYDDWVSDLDYC